MNSSTRLMKTFIKHTLWMAMLLLALPGEGQAQTFYRENETAIDIFHKLDELFPKRFLTQRWMTGAQYWVQHWYETPSDYQAHKAQVAALFNELDETPYFHKNIDMTDSAGVQRAKYIMSFPSDIRGQQDYLTLTADNTGVWFYYQATNRFANLKTDDIPDQSIVEAVMSSKLIISPVYYLFRNEVSFLAVISVLANEIREEKHSQDEKDNKANK